MDSIQPFLDSISTWFQANPIWGGLIALALYLIRSGTIKLPWKLPLLSPASDPIDSHPLLNRLTAKLQEKVKAALSSVQGDTDAEDAVFREWAARIESDLTDQPVMPTSLTIPKAKST